LKLTPGGNFTYILCTAFTCANPKSAKRLIAWLYFLRFWDLRKYIKAVHKMLVKLTPGGNPVKKIPFYMLLQCVTSNRIWLLLSFQLKLRTDEKLKTNLVYFKSKFHIIGLTSGPLSLFFSLQIWFEEIRTI